MENNNEINLKRKINEISENKIIILDNKEEKNIKYKYDNVKIISSEKSGLGISSYIKYKVIQEKNMKYNSKTLDELCDVKIGRTPPRNQSEWFNSGASNDWKFSL